MWTRNERASSNRYVVREAQFTTTSGALEASLREMRPKKSKGGEIVEIAPHASNADIQLAVTRIGLHVTSQVVVTCGLKFLLAK